MKTIRFLSLIAVLFINVNTAPATTVIPPTFNALVDEAELIFQGTVTDVRCQWIGDGSERRIVSYVTFQIEEAIKGDPGTSYTLRMLGGTIDGETMGVADAPTFRQGDRDILFVENNGRQFIPLVGIMYGRFRVRAGNVASRDIVTSDSGGPVGGVVGLGAAEFKAAIRTRLVAPSR